MQPSRSRRHRWQVVDEVRHVMTRELCEDCLLSRHVDVMGSAHYYDFQGRPTVRAPCSPIEHEFDISPLAPPMSVGCDR